MVISSALDSPFGHPFDSKRLLVQAVLKPQPGVRALLLDLSLLQAQIVAVTLPTLGRCNRITRSTVAADLEEEPSLLRYLQLH